MGGGVKHNVHRRCMTDSTVMIVCVDYHDDYDDDNEMCVYSLVDALRRSGGKLYSRFLQTPVFMVIPKSACVKTAEIDTIAELWEHFAISMNSLFYNIHTMLDTSSVPWPRGSFGDQVKGAPVLPNDSFGIVWDILRDLEHHANVLGLPHW